MLTYTYLPRLSQRIEGCSHIGEPPLYCGSSSNELPLALLNVAVFLVEIKFGLNKGLSHASNNCISGKIIFKQ